MQVAREGSVRLWLAATAIATLGLLAVGCGGSDSTSSPSSSNSDATTTKSQGGSGEETPASAEGPLGPLSEQLEEQGFRGTAPQPDDGDVEWHLTAEPKSGPPTIEVTYYRDASIAEKEGKEIKKIYGNHAGQGLVYYKGRLLVQVGAEKKLSQSTEEAFEEVLADAEGIE